MKNVDLFYCTGFDVINIPCSPDLLYDEYSGQKISFTDVNLIQTDWLGEITLEIDSEKARNIDYAIVTDEDTDERTCYIVDHYEMLTEDTCKLYMLLDAYNTMGGFEPGSGNTVIAGSANRISVPLIHTTDGKFPTAEDNTFFTLEEPFQPSNRLVHQAIQLTPEPIPVPPTPPTPDVSWQDLRYPTNNTATGTVGYIKRTNGAYQMGGSPGAPTMSIHLSAGEYQDVQVLSSLPGTFDPTVFTDRFEFLDSIKNNITYNYQYIISQKSNFTTDHQILFNDIETAILPAVMAYITDQSVSPEESNRTDYLVYITPHFIDENGVDKYIIQNGTGDAATVRLASPVTPPFQDKGIYYNVRIKVPTCGDHRLAVKRNGDYILIS